MGCGGGLIAKKHVLTAAHCACRECVKRCSIADCQAGRCAEEIPNTMFPCEQWEDLVASVGDHDIRKSDGEQKIDIDHVILHEKFQGIQHPIKKCCFACYFWTHFLF